MESDPSVPTIITRSRSLLEAIRDEPSDVSNSTPSASYNAIHRHESSFTMPSTPEELENMFAERIAAMNLASSITPERISIAASSGVSIASSSAPTIHPRIMPQEVPHTAYKTTSSISCDTLKSNKLTEGGHDNKKRKEMILSVLKSEDLLTMLSGQRLLPIRSTGNENGYSPRTTIQLNGKDTIICADDRFLYSHDSNRLYVALSIAISESIQYLFPMATDNENGILLWTSTIEHLFGSTYKDILDATDKLRRWSIDPSKNLRSDLHTLSILITRVNETSKASFPESSILAIIYDAIAKDPREELRQLCNFSSWEKIGLSELMRKLHDSPHTMPFHNKNVKMHEFKNIINQGYCYGFQTGKCKFGEKCKYRHEINPDNKKTTPLIEKKKFNNNKDKIQQNKNIKRTFTPNNYYNSLTGEPRGKSANGEPPKYSNGQILTIKNLIKTNKINNNDNEVNSTWLFSKPAASSNINPRMYVLKRLHNTVQHTEMHDFSQDPENFSWKYNNKSSSSPDNTNFIFKPENHQNSDMLIHEFLKTNVKGKIIYNLDQFLIRASYGYASDQGYFEMKYHVNILGWNNPHVHELDPSSKVFNSKNHQFMNLIYTLGKHWLKSYVQLPHASTYVYGTENAKFDDDAFMNFSPDVKRYHLPDSGGSYITNQFILQ